MKKLLLSPWTALLTLFLVLGLRIADYPFIESIRLRYFDTLITSKQKVENNIYTINIDESSITKYGQFPFKRDIYGKIISELYQKNAGLVIFNLLMSESDKQNGDIEFVNTLKQYPVILPSIPSDFTKNSPKNPGSAVLNPEFANTVVNYPGIIANIKEIEESAVGVGIVNTLPEIDGVTRRMPLVVSVNEKLYPALSLETLRVLAGDSTFQVKLSELGVEKLRIPSFGPITTDTLSRIWIDWSQTSKSYSLSSLPDDFNSGIVIVGTAASGISNPVATAMGGIFPHEVQASVISTLISGSHIERPDYADLLEITTLGVLGFLLIYMTRWVYIGLFSTVLLVISAYYASALVFEHYLFLFDATIVIIGLVLVALHGYGVKFVSEFLQKLQIKQQFGTYLSPAMVQRLQDNPELLKLGGEYKELSIMFGDVRGFSSISEHFGKDVEGLVSIMNRLMTVMSQPILDNNGMIDKYIGDCIMAEWNTPLDDNNHAINAVRSALEMLNRLKEFNNEIEKEGIPPFGMGLGINTDTVVVGNMGSSSRFDFTCLGDGVNLASRIEGQSKDYGVKIIIGIKTANYVKDSYLTLELDTIKVKGKTIGETIFTVLGNFDDIWYDEDIIRKHGHMLSLYRQQRWVDARKLCYDLTGEFDGQMDKYYDMMLKRIENYESTNLLTADWDGVYVATSK
jgi:adenylate cyclase